MDNGSNGSQTMDVASSDDQSMTDVAASDDEIEDEEMNSDDDRKAVSLILYRSYTFYITFQTFPMTSEVDANENSIQVPIGVAVFSKGKYFESQKLATFTFLLVNAVFASGNLFLRP